MGCVYFVRHGQTIWNAENRICGSSDIALTKLGHEQAIKTGEIILEQGIKADEILYSPLIRAKDTALHISEITGIPARVEPRLIEQNFGKYEASARNGQEFKESKKQFAIRYEGGESMLRLGQRIYNLLDDIKASGKTYILVAHNGIARSVQSYFYEMTNDEYASFGIDNCTLVKYEWDNEEETGADNTDADSTDADSTGADNTDADNTDADNTDADNTDADNTDADSTDADSTGADNTDATSDIHHGRYNEPGAAGRDIYDIASKIKSHVRKLKQKEYAFWGNEKAAVPALITDYKGISNQFELYDALSEIWCAYTCAPRMRDGWNKGNRTLGQCSITAFLAQDIFGGKVFGIPLPEGGYHCFNVVGDCRFDLTSEQFGGKILDYDAVEEQFKEVHFAKEEKRLRYEYLKAELSKYCKS